MIINGSEPILLSDSVGFRPKMLAGAEHQFNIALDSLLSNLHFLKSIFRLYVNGQELVPPVKDATGDISTATPLLIGYDYSTGSFMAGALDEIRVYKSVLLPKVIGAPSG